ncbi:MAG: nucleotide sugar dehydrogenase [Nitrospinota bacterium]|nr:nucleotide sugar dehydrogenase [Nitrospinota bacterium]
MNFTENLEAVKTKKKPIAIVGLGYVGLPIAMALGKYFKITGFDINEKRIADLNRGVDHTGECTDLLNNKNVSFTTDQKLLADCPIVIIAVPTPVTNFKAPDLGPLESAMRIVGKNIHKPALITVESTVYPGATELVSSNILEGEFGLKRGTDYKVGYSPERINPGDKEHTIENTTKIVAAEDQETLSILEYIFGKVTKTFSASNIKTAEAAKVIENIQRDLNIALVNELALIFDRLDINTNEVIDAASTKWNFHSYRPGLVGGHCIGVDPYYLAHCAESLGYIPEVILSSRRINESVGNFISGKLLKLLIESGRDINGANVGILGFTFKENIRDIRNTRVVDIVKLMKEHRINVFVSDPWASPQEMKAEYGIQTTDIKDLKNLDAIVLAVRHDQYVNQKEEFFLNLCNIGKKPVFMDVKSVYNASDMPNFLYWRL